MMYAWAFEHKAYAKQCSTCKKVYVGTDMEASSIVKFQDNFSGRNSSADGFHNQCRSCIASAHHNREHCDRDVLLESQNGKCAICAADVKFGSNACVDHNHNTRKVRGVLCISCNSRLVSALEDAEWLKLAMLYLERHSK